MAMTSWARGAEAVLDPALHLGRTTLAKRRLRKPYRHPALDHALRDGRTRDETNLLLAARRAGVAVPVVYDADRADATLLLEPIAGCTLREQLPRDAAPAAAGRLEALGRALARLHAAGIVHGDPTSSNVLGPDPADPGRVVLVDFGLGSFTEDEEEKGVDLHLVEEALEATEARSSVLMAALLKGYGQGPRQQAVLRRLEAIRERGRYR